MSSKIYLYGIISANEDKSFGPIGLSTNGTPSEIRLKAFSGLGVVYTEKEIEDDEEIPATRKNLINHQKVIEHVMITDTILPFSFGTVVENYDLLADLMAEKAEGFKQSLLEIEGKIELSLKVMWQDMDQIFASILTENVEVREKKEFLAVNNIQDQNEKIALGQLVEAALVEKKETALNKILDKLESLSLGHKVQKNITEAMFANLAFLVEKSEESKFDAAVNELSEEMNENTTFKYVGPMPPYNFIG